MTAYKCDICGVLFEKINYLRIKKLKVERIAACAGVTNFDICPDCVAAIQKTIDKRSGGKVDD